MACTTTELQSRQRCAGRISAERNGRHARVAGLLLFLLVIVVVEVNAQADWETISSGHQVSVNREYYDIHGSTAQELLAEMQRKGPSGDTPSDRYYAITTSQSSFRYETIRRGNICSLTSIGVKTEIVVQLPRWDGENENTEVGRAWRDFMKHLVEHEYGHVSISRSGSEKMFFALKAVRPADCRTLKEVSQVTVQRISDQLQKENGDYDAMTGHGRTQGAVWRVVQGTR